MVSSKADGRKNPIGLFVLFLAYGWSKIECEVRICRYKIYEKDYGNWLSGKW